MRGKYNKVGRERKCLKERIIIMNRNKERNLRDSDKQRQTMAIGLLPISRMDAPVAKTQKRGP